MSMTGQTTTSVRVMDSWKEESPQPQAFPDGAIPPRSKLYGLMPCGLGTLFQESLTSYLNRLGRRHGVSPRALVAQEFLPHLTSEYPQYHLAAFSRGTAVGINGTGTVAVEWASVLEQLTQRSDLHWLTLRWWIGDIQPRGLLRKVPAWCPACYAAWKEGALSIYQPLLWMFLSVTLCPEHEIGLIDRCPHCQKYQSVISSKKTPAGWCTQCNIWLGGTGNLLPGMVSEKQREQQAWVIRILEELRVENASSEGLSWKYFFENLATCMKERGAPSKLADLTGMDRNVFYFWTGRMHLSYTPSFETILAFCYACNVTPLQFMRTPAVLFQKMQQEALPQRLQSKPKRNRVDRKRCQDVLQAVLDGCEEPLGITSLAQRLGYHESLLLRYFPAECQQITQLAQEHRKQRRARYTTHVCEEVRHAVMDLHARGIFPSHRKVRALLSDPNYMRMPEASAAWHATRRELGLEQ